MSSEKIQGNSIISKFNFQSEFIFHQIAE